MMIKRPCPRLKPVGASVCTGDKDVGSGMSEEVITEGDSVRWDEYRVWGDLGMLEAAKVGFVVSLTFEKL